MKRRDLLLALMGVASLSQLPTVLAAPKPKYPRGQTPSFSHLDEAAFYPQQPGLDFGPGDFTVEFWMAPTKKQWEAIVMTQGELQLHGYVNGVQVCSGVCTLKDYRFQGAGILAQIGNGADADTCVADFMRHMQQHMPHGHLADLRVTRDLVRKTEDGTYRFPIKQHNFPYMVPLPRLAV